MKPNFFSLLVVLSVGLVSPATLCAGSETGDLAGEVLSIFTAKCATCHGPQLAKPRGHFGYVLDLEKMAKNPDWLVPSKPDESTLFLLLRNDEMPPPDAETGPLTASEKDSVREWIAAGMPLRSLPRESIPEEPVSGLFVPRLLRWLGKFHLLLLHFPLALLIAAAGGELWSVCRKDATPSAVVRYCLCLGAAAAIPTVALGWLYALGGHGAGSPGLLALHRWLGTTVGITAVAAATGSEWEARRGTRSRSVRLLVVLGALLAAAAAHFGGELAHGKEFFHW